MCKIVQNVQNCAKLLKMCKMCKIVQNVPNCAKQCKNCAKCAKLCKMKPYIVEIGQKCPFPCQPACPPSSPPCRSKIVSVRQDRGSNGRTWGFRSGMSRPNKKHVLGDLETQTQTQTHTHTFFTVSYYNVLMMMVKMTILVTW